MAALSQVSQMTEQTFDRALSLRLDAILKAIADVQAWPESAVKRACLGVLLRRLQQLEAQISE